MSLLIVILAFVVGLGLIAVLVGYAVVWTDRHQRRSGDQAGTVKALQMALFSVAQAAERHHDAIALNGSRMEGTTTVPAAAEAEARTAASTYTALVQDRQLKSLSTQILAVSSRLLATRAAPEAVRLQAELTVLQDRFRARSIEVTRDLSRRRFARS